MGKYILEIFVLVLVGLMLTPFIMGAVRVLKKKYLTMVDNIEENDK